MIQWLKRTVCSHEFALEDLRNTGIPALVKPTSKDYAEWSHYLSNLTTHESHTRRVSWPCQKCGKVFYAHCGLDIAPSHGPIAAPRGDHATT